MKINSIKLLFLINNLLLFYLFMNGCSTIGVSARMKTVDVVQLPFIKNSANECYYLDEFMPTPDNMVAGKSGPMALRYYTYKAADYKDWESRHIVLSFYSRDEKCWSLFEEYYIN